MKKEPNVGEAIDLASLYSTPWVYVDEKVCAAIQGRSVSSIQHDRCTGIGAPYKKINGKCVRYKVADILQFIESQPSGGAAAATGKPKRGRPRKVDGANMQR